MERIQSEWEVEQAERLREYAKAASIPYVLGGMSLAGMDCQGLCEYLLIRCGVPKKECNLSGSNAHWRACVWRGTPEACAARFGRVPAGAWVFIVNEEDGGAPAKYRGDGLGDACHMGVYVGKGVALHASASRGCVAESRFEGKTVANGGWNRVGLPRWIDFGLDAQDGAAGEGGDAALPGNAGGMDGSEPARACGAAAGAHGGEAAVSPAMAVDVRGFYRVKRGCLGGAVRRLQTWLTELGYDVGPYGADGNFGADTEAAVRSFQRESGLREDGVAGRETWGELAQGLAVRQTGRPAGRG